MWLDLFYDMLWKIFFFVIIFLFFNLQCPEKYTGAKNIPITTVDPLISKTRISATVTDNLDTIK